uniref:Odorant receptor n=2 Tax=Lutzomyia longipalpis TaxID=7200 RepID=A0A240SXP7_LUTLO
MSSQLEEFRKAKPKIDFLFALLTMNVTSGSRKNRFLLLFFAFFNIISLFFVILHLKNIKFELNFNSLITFLTFGAIAGNIFRISLGLIKKDKIEMLLQNIRVLLGTFIFGGSALLSGFYFRFNEEYGLMFEVPFIASDKILWKNFLYVLQGFFYITVAITTIFLDVGVILLGLQVIAELNILIDYIKSLNEKIKSDPQFLSKIIKRHCSVIENLDLLSEITSETSILQLFLTCISLLFGFTLVQIYAIGLGNYIIILCAAALSLPICILGEFIRIQTDNLSETPYLTNWYELSLKDQKTLLIILGMAQREYGLKAIGMYDVNLYTYIQVRWNLNFFYQEV